VDSHLIQDSPDLKVLIQDFLDLRAVRPLTQDFLDPRAAKPLIQGFQDLLQKDLVHVHLEDLIQAVLVLLLDGKVYHLLTSRKSFLQVKTIPYEKHLLLKRPRLKTNHSREDRFLPKMVKTKRPQKKLMPISLSTHVTDTVLDLAMKTYGERKRHLSLNNRCKKKL
jgi:hypothetical protein